MNSILIDISHADILRSTSYQTGMNLTKLQQRLENGSRRKLGKITIEVKTSEI